MPQGKVIAVQPSYSGDQPQSMRMMQQSQGSSHQEHERHTKPDFNVVIIGECKGKIDTCDTKKVKSIVWYEDAEFLYQVGDYVDFEVDRKKQKEFSGVLKLKKIKDGKTHFPEGILSKVVLLASLLLLGLLVKDKRSK